MFSALVCLLTTYPVFAENAQILSVNNQATFSLIGGTEHYRYDSQHVPFLKNMEGSKALGANVVLTKTFEHALYTAFNLSILRNYLNYDDSSLGLDDASSQQIQLQGKLGWSFYPNPVLAFTPYLTFGYRYEQLNSGGLYDSQAQTSLLGSTQFLQTAYYGLGLLSQWAVTPRFVLSLEGSISETLHPWTRANVPYYDGTSYIVIFQQANLSNQPYVQLGLKGDYEFNTQLHGIIGMQYEHLALGGGSTTPMNLYSLPAQRQSALLYSLGLGYTFGNSTLATSDVAKDAGSKEAIQAANNQGSLHVGTFNQNYGETSSNRNGYLDRQEGTVPMVAMDISKTFHGIYTQAELSEAIGGTAYLGSLQDGTPFNTRTRNTFTDLFARLGYQFFPSEQLALTPYATIGYHRWLRDTSGIPYDHAGTTVLLNGYPETYTNAWYGAGFMLQYATSSTWVLSAFAEGGRTFHAALASWSTLDGITAQSHFDLQPHSYYQIGAGSDYAFADHWHFLANISYFRFGYGMSEKNNIGGLEIWEPDSTTGEIKTSLGVGYTF